MKCSVCGKNLLEDPSMSMIIITRNDNHQITLVKPCCKGKCGDILSVTLKAGEHEGWKELIEFTNPYTYLKHIIAVMNLMHDNRDFENDSAFEDYKNLVVSVYPFIARDLTESEISYAQLSNELPF